METFIQLAKIIGPWPALAVAAAIFIGLFVTRTVWPFFTDKVWPAKQANEAKKAEAQKTESEALRALAELISAVRDELRNQTPNWNRRFDNLETGQRAVIDKVAEARADIAVLFDRMRIERPTHQERADVKEQVKQGG